MHARHYGWLERWLHWLALEPQAVRELSFELERLYALRKRTAALVSPPDPANGPVYVCGLARSGTTLLLNLLAECDSFRSLTYRDMPFVLAPNLWRRLSGFAQREARAMERAHGDQVSVDYDSPEAFEEVFWRTFSQSGRVHGAVYGSTEVEPEAMQAFADFRQLVAGNKRYLSKNNNNLLRLESLAADPTATVFVVYRDPLETASSLHRMHLRFCAAAEEPFNRRYMEWLGHHEFGPGHKPFAFAKPLMDPALDPSQPDYWLDYWNAIYTKIFHLETTKIWFHHHNSTKQETIADLIKNLKIITSSKELNTPASAIKISTIKPEHNIVSYSHKTVKTALELYSKIKYRNHNIT